jgi:O-antigen ligase
VLLACLLLTYSRSALMGLGVGVGIMGLVRYRRLLPWIALAALLVLLLPQTQAYVQRLLQGARGEDLATQMRFGEYKDALTLIGRHPWLGVGFAGAPDIDVYLGVSNLYLLIAEETGIAGLGLFLAIAALTLRQVAAILRSVARNPRLEAVGWGVLAALIGILSSGAFDHYFFNINFQHAVALLWLCIGLAIAVTLLPNGSASTAIQP